ncbi:MAG: carbonic anhydrase family protein [Burkholderiales bacterium]
MTLLPADRSYYTFESSLTTPPCTEGVKWFVLKHPLELSAAQLARFARLYRHNERPLQPLNGRLISESAD